MGAGIAQTAACAGWRVHLVDLDLDTCEASKQGIITRLARNVEKGRMSQTQADAAAERIAPSTTRDLHGCELFIEAIVEDLNIKVAAVTPVLDVLPEDAIIATNTSSLSVSEFGERIEAAPRTCGMHFFNPAAIMKLVEVVSGNRTEQRIVDRVADVATQWGKKVARCADTPGFIVNRVARPYYLEAFRCLEDGIAGPPTIDSAMKLIGGFRMGPFELTDFIGHDVNAATTRSVWKQWECPARLAPVAAQEAMVAEGNLGRKSGCGVYDWSGPQPVCVYRPTQDAATSVGGLDATALRFCEAATQNAEALADSTEQQRIVFTRILAALLNEAAWAAHQGVADPADIDVAMRAGVNYPRGLFAWADDIGGDLVSETLARLNESVDDNRFAAPS
jgi:3-hydroxybutyryl-CoA dehydrogenase